MMSQALENIPWGWQQVVLAAAIARKHRVLSDEDLNVISSLVAPDTHQDVPDYAAKAFTEAVKYLACRQENYRNVSRACDSVYTGNGV
jgi:hypothetical protein